MKKTFAYGLNVLETLCRERPQRIIRVFLDSSSRNPRIKSIDQQLRQLGVGCEYIATAKLTSLAGGGHHQGVVAEVTAAQTLDEDALFALLADVATPFLCILENIQDPRNLGACLRSAEAAGVDAVILSKHDSSDITPVVQQVSTGAADLVSVARVTNMARVLERLRHDAGVWVVGATDDADQVLFDIDLSGPVAMVFGAEGRGLKRLTRKSCDYLGRIPMAGKTASLNVSVATGIGLFEVVRQRNYCGEQRK